MNPDPSISGAAESVATPDSPSARLFLHEAGWQVALKFGSDREFCYLMAPGQDYYHRLYAGELYLHRSDEKLCLACARRRGLLTSEPRHLERASIISAANLDPNSPEYELADPEETEIDVQPRRSPNPDSAW